MLCFVVSLASCSSDSETMEIKVTPQETSTGNREGIALFVGVAVDASVCRVAGKHSGRLCRLAANAEAFFDHSLVQSLESEVG